MTSIVFPRSVRPIVSIFVLTVSLLWVGKTYAQVSGATISGTVTDPTGAVVYTQYVTGDQWFGYDTKLAGWYTLSLVYAGAAGATSDFRLEASYQAPATT